jgi:hypothetical protein
MGKPSHAEIYWSSQPFCGCHCFKRISPLPLARCFTIVDEHFLRLASGLEAAGGIEFWMKPEKAFQVRIQRCAHHHGHPAFVNTGIARIAGIEFDNMIFRFCTFVCLQTKRGVPAISYTAILYRLPGAPGGRAGKLWWWWWWWWCRMTIVCYISYSIIVISMVETTDLFDRLLRDPLVCHTSRLPLKHDCLRSWDVIPNGSNGDVLLFFCCYQALQYLRYLVLISLWLSFFCSFKPAR